jgi:hypothetical protein
VLGGLSHSSICSPQAAEKVGMKVTVHPSKSGGAQSKYSVSVDHKYSSIIEKPSSPQAVKQVQKESHSTSILLEAGNSGNATPVSVEPEPSAGIKSTWTSMKTGFQSFKSSMSSKKLLPLNLSRTSSSTSEALDEIFQGLKRQSSNTQVDYLDDDDDSTVDMNRTLR